MCKKIFLSTLLLVLTAITPSGTKAQDVQLRIPATSINNLFDSFIASGLISYCDIVDGGLTYTVTTRNAQIFLTSPDIFSLIIRIDWRVQIDVNLGFDIIHPFFLIQILK